MGRPQISETIKIRKQIIALQPDDFDDLVRDIEIIVEIREEAARQAEALEEAAKS